MKYCSYIVYTVLVLLRCHNAMPVQRWVYFYPSSRPLIPVPTLPVYTALTINSVKIQGVES